MISTPRPQKAVLLALLCSALNSSAYITQQSRGQAPSDNADGNRSASTVFNNGPTPADGSTQGNPATFSWSIVPDGTKYFASSLTTGSFRVSDVVSHWDSTFGVPLADQTTDLTNRPWFTGLSDGLELITKRCGVTYIYEPNDDGIDCTLYWGSAGESDPGLAGVRGDLRFAGSQDLFSGGLSSTSCGERHHPEIYMNTGRFSSAASLRFVMCHEALHALSFSHSTVNSSSNQSAVTGAGGTNQGPQFDDIAGLHRKYGDFFEKAGGNDTAATATDIGTVDFGDSIIIGDDADDTTVSIDQFDFISIDDNSDTDFLKFTIANTQEVTLTLDPRGPTYTNFGTDWVSPFREDNTITIIADQINDLAFELYDSSNNLLHTVSNTNFGDSEVLTVTLPAGDYYAKVMGLTPNPETPDNPNTTVEYQYYGAQLYAFSVESSVLIPEADDIAAFVESGSSLNFTLTGSDGNGDPLTFTAQSPNNGTLSGTAPNLTYTPAPGFTGTETFTYVANDGTADSPPATISIIVYAPHELLAGYDFDDGTNTPTLTVTTTHSNITGSDFGVGAGLGSPINTSGNALAENTDAEGNLLGTANPISFGGTRDNSLLFTRQGGLSNAIAVDEYLTFTVTPQNAAEMNFFNLTFRAYMNNLTESVTSWSLYSSLDAFATAIDQGETTTAGVWVSHEIDLLKAEYQGLTQPVEFRLYIYDGRNNSGSLTLFDKFALNGSTKLSLTGYDAFIAASAGLTNSGFNDDPDGDGIPNGIEYLLGADPQSTTDPLPAVSTSGTDLIFTLNRNVDSTSDTSQFFQHSTDLQTWTDVNLTGAISPNVTLAPPSAGFEEIQITVDNSTPFQKLFWRLKAEQNN